VGFGESTGLVETGSMYQLDFKQDDLGEGIALGLLFSASQVAH
jgi:hypothetical protein